MKITQINRQNLQLLRDEMNTALKSVADKYGVNIDIGNASFNANNVRFKVEISTVGDDGQVNDKDAQNFKLYARLNGLQETDLGKTVTVQGQSFTITGYRPKCDRFPIMATRTDGKMFKLPLDTVRNQLRNNVLTTPV